MISSRIKKVFFTLMALVVVSCSIKHVKHDIDHLPEPAPIGKVDVALILGGGGSRGIAHLGVINVLEEHGVPIDLIVGTSAGAIVGALYADNPDSKKIKSIVIKQTIDDYMDFSYYRGLHGFFDLAGPISGDAMERTIAKNITNDDFSKLKIPLVVVATDINRIKSLAIAGGKVSSAVRASSMVPPFFSPTNIYGRLLVDGGVVEPVPVITAKRYNPKVTIAVDISIDGYDMKVKNMIDTTLKSMYASYYIMSRMQSSLADITIHPNLEGFGMFLNNFDEELFQKGREEALNMLPKIIALLHDKGIYLKPKINYFPIKKEVNTFNLSM